MLNTLALALLAVAVLECLERRPLTALALLTAQGVLLTAAALLIAPATGDLHGAFAVVLTFAVKVVAIPAVLLHALWPLTPRGLWPLAMPKRRVVALALVLVLAAFHAVEPLTLATDPGSVQVLPAAVGVMLLGMFAMLVQRSAPAQVIGLVTMENGLYLAALAATRGFPLAVELGVAIDALVATAVMSLVSRQIRRVFTSHDTEALRTLRG